MTTLAEAMRRWREEGVAPFATPPATVAEAQRLIRLEFAERRVRTLCPDEASALCILELAPEDNGTQRRAVHLEAAARAIAKGWPVASVAEMLRPEAGVLLFLADDYFYPPGVPLA